MAPSESATPHVLDVRTRHLVGLNEVLDAVQDAVEAYVADSLLPVLAVTAYGEILSISENGELHRSAMVIT